MPESIIEVARLLLPALNLIYNCTEIMKDTAQYLIDIPVTTSAVIFPFNNSDYNV
jgi:hypothetical protein